MYLTEKIILLLSVNFIVVCQFYNTKGCPVQKKFVPLLTYGYGSRFLSVLGTVQAQTALCSAIF
jgi:hypothetical protein